MHLVFSNQVILDIQSNQLLQKKKKKKKKGVVLKHFFHTWQYPPKQPLGMFSWILDLNVNLDY